MEAVEAVEGEEAPPPLQFMHFLVTWSPLSKLVGDEEEGFSLVDDWLSCKLQKFKASSEFALEPLHLEQPSSELTGLGFAVFFGLVGFFAVFDDFGGSLCIIISKRVNPTPS